MTDHDRETYGPDFDGSCAHDPYAKIPDECERCGATPAADGLGIGCTDIPREDGTGAWRHLCNPCFLVEADRANDGAPAPTS